MPDERQRAVQDLVSEWLRRAKSDLVLANSDYAVSARYPGEMDEVNRQEARTAVDLANRMFDWVETQIDEG